jgi:hypothetical protein
MECFGEFGDVHRASLGRAASRSSVKIIPEGFYLMRFLLNNHRTLVWVWLSVLLVWPLAAHAQGGELPSSGFGPAAAHAPSSWSAYGLGYHMDASVRHDGYASALCVATGTTETTGAVCAVTLNQKTAQPLIISGWSRAQNVDGVPDNDYSVYVDLTYMDGSVLWGQTASFATGTHGWQERQLILQPTKPLRSMNVYALFRNHAGTVWFAGFTAHLVSAGGLFDGQALAPPMLSASSSGGWFVRDVAARKPLMPITPSHPALGMRLENLRAGSQGHLIQATLRNLTNRPRALTLYYVVRFTASHLVWWNDIRSMSPVLPHREYANLTSVGAGANGQLSLYPFGCVTGQGAGLTLGVPPTLGPRITRIGFQAASHLMFVATDLALMRRGAVGGHDSAPVAVVRYASDPHWGFRDAAARYYALFPAAFQRLAHAEGIWMPFTDPATVAHVSDFHIAYHEGDNSVASDRRLGILSFRYVEPMTYWMSMAPGVPRTYAAALALVHRQAVSAVPTMRRQAQAVLSSGSQDAQGHFNVAFRDTPWCNGAVWILDPDPALPNPGGLWTKARLNALGEPTQGAADQPDGEYLDSLEAWADVLDYRPASLRATDAALTFDTDTYRPVLPTWFSVYESSAALSRDLHRHGKLLMANSVPWRFSAFASLLDIMGTETNMFSDTGAWQPEPDAVMNLRRTMSDQKPYLLLMNTDFSKTDQAKIALYFQRCMFYGIYPSMFSADASSHPYWQDPKLYNRDRSLFQEYIPAIQRLAEAGWQPVTWAESNRPDVWVERYGTRYLTVLNSGSVPENVTVRIAVAHFAPSNRVHRQLQVSDLLAGSRLAWTGDHGTVSVSVLLRPSETRVLSLQRIFSDEKGTKQ